MKQIRLILCLSVVLLGTKSLAAVGSKCEFATGKVDKLEITQEVDRKTGECVTTLSPLSNIDGHYQIISFTAQNLAVLKSEGQRSQTKQFQVVTSKNASSPVISFKRNRGSVLVQWGKSWIEFSTATRGIMSSNFISTKALTSL
ncbi:MAG: hypothetical protein V4736_05975 [Bdellovibrionota bacterium]